MPHPDILHGPTPRSTTHTKRALVILNTRGGDQNPHSYVMPLPHVVARAIHAIFAVADNGELDSETVYNVLIQLHMLYPFNDQSHAALTTFGQEPAKRRVTCTAYEEMQ